MQTCPSMVGAQQHWGPRLWVPGALAQARNVLLAVPCKGKAWLMAPYGCSCQADPAWFVLRGSFRRSHPAQLIPHSHPTHQLPRGAVGRKQHWQGERQTGNGLTEHHSRATRNGARAKNSSRAACSAGQPLLGREGALPPPAEPLGHGPHRGRSCQAATEQELPSRKRSPGAQEGL